MVILPKKKVSLQELEKKIAVLNFLDLFANVKQQDLTMHLPKFQIEVTASLNDPLEKVRSIFSVVRDIKKSKKLFADGIF